MSPIAWFRWRLRRPGRDPSTVTGIAQIVAWQETKREAGWIRSVPALGDPAHPDRRGRLWTLWGALWSHAGATRTANVELIGRFFEAFWPVFAREASAAGAPLPPGSLRQSVQEASQAVDAALSAPGEPGERVWSLGNACWQYLMQGDATRDGVAITVIGVGATNLMVEVATLLDDLPKLKPR